MRQGDDLVEQGKIVRKELAPWLVQYVIRLEVAGTSRALIGGAIVLLLAGGGGIF